MKRHSLASSEAELIEVLRRAALSHLAGGHAVQKYGAMSTAATFLSLIDDIPVSHDPLGVRWLAEASAARGGIPATLAQEADAQQASADIEIVKVRLIATPEHSLATMPLFQRLVKFSGGDVSHPTQKPARTAGLIRLYFDLSLPPARDGRRG